MRRTPDRYDVIQASLVDTWAATAAGAHTLTENTLYTVDAFNDYLDHLNDDGRPVDHALGGRRPAPRVARSGGVRARVGGPPPIVSRSSAMDSVATFPAEEDAVHRGGGRCSSRGVADRLGFDVLYAPDTPATPGRATRNVDVDADDGDYARLIHAPDRQQFYRDYRQDIRPTTDDRPFFFHTTKLEHQFSVAFGQTMLFGNGLSALLTLLGISGDARPAVRRSAR